MDRKKLERFLDLLENATGDWLDAFWDAGCEVFGTSPDVREVLEALNISDIDAEVMFQRLPADPGVLAAYLRPNLLGSRD